MPTINIYYSDEQYETSLSSLIEELKEFVAKALTCGDITLNTDDPGKYWFDYIQREAFDRAGLLFENLTAEA